MLTALREARRVVWSGGTVVAKALSRFYPVFEGLVAGEEPGPGWMEDTVRFLNDGQYRNPAGNPDLFTTSYFHQLENCPARSAKQAWSCESSSPLAGASSSSPTCPGGWTPPTVAITCRRCCACWKLSLHSTA
jgi:hypothetical protein